jgi:PAS domain S-box-containing protein
VALTSPVPTSIAQHGSLIGGGETGALMRDKDWSRTPLGPVEKWPQSLQTSVSICLDSRFPIVMYWGPEFVVLYNDAYSAILGGKHPWALGQRCRDCWAEIWDTIGPMLESVVRTGQATWSNDLLLVLYRYGYAEECYFSFSFSPVRVEAGAVGGVFTAVIETTETVIGARRLRTLRDLAAKAADAKSEYDACRTAAETLAENLRDMPFSALCASTGRGFSVVCSAGLAPDHPLNSLLAEGNSNFAREMRRVVDSGQTLEVGLQNLDCDIPCGDWDTPPSTALLMPIPAMGPGGSPGVLVCAVSPRKRLDESYRTFFSLVDRQIATSIADARSHEEERKRSEALAELDRAKTVFFSNISHEFRTPLALILGPLEETLSRGKLLPEDSAQLNMVHRNGLRLLKLVNTLLDFSRIEAGRIQVAYEPTDLASFTLDLASVFRSAIERAGMRLNVDCPPLSEPVYVDRDMWEKIVLNLLSNAFKYTLHGEIAVALKPAGERVELSVRDTGTGIASAELPHIFERFYRVQNSRARTNEGSGIGLALAQELAKIHGGSITVDSTPGAGSKFTVSIPFGSGHLPADRIQAARLQVSSALGAEPYIQEALRWLPDQKSAASLGVFPALPELQGISRTSALEVKAGASEIPRILVADDNADMRDYVQRLLRDDYEVQTAGDGEGALRIAREKPPDLILADVMMPRLDGFGLLKALRADETLNSIPVILLSARAGEESRIGGLQSGADDYLVKPFSARELSARVASHLAVARIRRSAAKVERTLRAEAEIERTRLRAAFTQTYALMVFLTPDGTVIDANRAAFEGVGFTREEVIGRKLWEPWWSQLPKETEILKASVEKAAGGESIREECEYCMADGTVRFADRTLTPVKDETGNVMMIVATGLDMTEAKQLRDGLETKVKERTAELEQAEATLRTVTGRLLRAQDEERRRIARELHDSAGQLLAALSMNLIPLEPKLREWNHDLGKSVTDSIFLVDELSRQLRTMSHLLHPPLLDEAGLASALAWYVDGFAERSKIKVEFDYDHKLGRLPVEMETAIFRLVQESLTNVHRHSGSPSAGIRIGRDTAEQSILVEVSDQGRGISGGTIHASGPAKPGIGIQGMRERVRQLGGKIEIRSSDRGTTIMAKFPVRASAAQPTDVRNLRSAS